MKDFYWRGYLTIKRRAPKWRYVIHDSFRFTADAWGGFMRGCPDIAIDTHIYQAWMDPGPRLKFYVDACQQKAKIAELERAFGPVIVGAGKEREIPNFKGSSLDHLSERSRRVHAISGTRARGTRTSKRR